jgi:hypothetical protein
MEIELVVARYNEDLNWLKKVPKNIKITIYNKGKDDINYPSIKLPNIGRESHTYLFHIIKNYDNLAEKTIFCQGDTIFHSPGFLNLLKKNNIEKFEELQPLSAFYWPEGEPPKYFSNPPIPLLNATKNLWIDNNPIHVEYMDNEFTTRYPYMYIEDYFVKLTNLMKKIYNTNNVFKFLVERYRIKNIDYNDLFPVCYAAIFSINKNVILDNSIDYYNNILNTLIYDIRYNNYKKTIDHGLYLEKLWLVIFNYKKYNKNYIKLPIKNFPIFDKNLTIKNNNNGSIINFKLFNIYAQIYIEFKIDDKIYKLFLSRYVILLKNEKEKILIHIQSRQNKLIQDSLKNMNEIIFIMFLKNNILNITVNKYKIIEYKFPYPVNKLTLAKIFSLTNINKFKNLLKNKNNLS